MIIKKAAAGYNLSKSKTAPQILFYGRKGKNPPCCEVGLIEKIDSRGSQGVCVFAGGQVS